MSGEIKHGELRPTNKEAIKPGPKLNGLLESLKGLNPQDTFLVLLKASQNGIIDLLCRQDIKNHPKVQGTEGKR